MAQQLEQTHVVIFGAPNRGKTFFSYQVGRLWHDISMIGNPAVRYASAGELDDEDLDDLTIASQQHRRSKTATLYILDDCHLNEEIARNLYTKASPPGVVVLLCFRGSSFNELPRWVLTLKEKTAGSSVFALTQNRRLNLEVIREYTRRVRRSATEEEMGALIRRSGFDLGSIVESLEAWSRNPETRLGQVDRNAVLDFIKEEYGIAPFNSDRCKALHVLAALGVREYTTPLEMLTCFSGAMQELLDEGLVSETPTRGGRYQLSNMKACEWVLRALSRYCKEIIPTDDSILHAYYERSIATGGVGIYALRWFAERRERELVCRILRDQNITPRLRSSLENISGAMLRKILHPVFYSLPPNERWRLHDLLTPSAITILSESLKGAPAYQIDQGMRVLCSTVHPRTVFDSWSLDDWQATTGKSSINSLKALAYSCL
ncbi:hypothetical protein ACWHA1_30350, partial [Streptomyces decoyicus]